MKLVDGLTGTTFSCTWRSPIGYRLRSDITIGEIIGSRQITLHSKGDLQGTVVSRLHESAGQTRIAIDWQVQTTKPWMNFLTPVLRPFFVHSHHAVMRSGERGLRDYLHTKK
jgi:hypothetical protein